MANSHSTGDAAGNEGLGNGEDRMTGGLDALPCKLRLLRQVYDCRHRRLPRALPHYVLRRHQSIEFEFEFKFKESKEIYQLSDHETLKILKTLEISTR